MANQKHKEEIDERDEDDRDEEDRDEDDQDDGKGKEVADDHEEVDVEDKKDDKDGKKEKEDHIEIVADERLVDTQKRSRDEETQEEKRERRRKEKQDKRARRLAAERRDKGLIQQLKRENEQTKRELTELKNLVPEFQKRMASQDELQLDNAISQQQTVYNAALKQLDKAITEGNGAVAIEAQRYIDDSRGKYNQLVALKQNINNQRTAASQKSEADDQGGQKTDQQLPFKPTELYHVYKNRWLAANGWFDPKSGDEDSELASAIDKKLLREGFDPNEKDFWEELTSRLKEESPHLFEESRPARKSSSPRPRQVNGNVAPDSYGGEKKSVRIPERVMQYARDAGLLDDPKKKQRFINNWKEQNGIS